MKTVRNIHQNIQKEKTKLPPKMERYDTNIAHRITFHFLTSLKLHHSNKKKSNVLATTASCYLIVDILQPNYVYYGNKLLPWKSKAITPPPHPPPQKKLLQK